MPHKLTYYEKISLKNKEPEEAERITKLFNEKTKYWDFDEALQIARMGLWKACLIWDPNKYRLSTLAYNIINRDFIDFDRQQKRQPDILFNLEDNIVTDDISLSDVLVDEEADVENEFIEDNEVKELSQDIIWILEDIAEDYKIHSGVIKLIYLIFIESTQDNQLNMRMIDFVPKQVVKQIVGELQDRLKAMLK